MPGKYTLLLNKEENHASAQTQVNSCDQMFTFALKKKKKLLVAQ